MRVGGRIERKEVPQKQASRTSIGGITTIPEGPPERSSTRKLTADRKPKAGDDEGETLLEQLEKQRLQERRPEGSDLGDAVGGPSPTNAGGNSSARGHGHHYLGRTAVAELEQRIARGSIEVREEAARQMAGLARGGTTLEAVVFVPPLVRLLEKGNATAMEQAAIALACMAEHDETSMGLMNVQGAVPPLVALLKHGSDQGKENASCAIAVLATSKGLKRTIEKSGALRRLIRLLSSENPTSRMYAALALGNLANSSEARKEAITARGGTMPLINLLSDEEGDETSLYAATALAHLANGDLERKKFIAAQGAIPTLVNMLRDCNKAVQTEVTRLLAELAQGGKTCCHMIMELGALPVLVGMIKSGIGETARYAAVAVANLIHGSETRKDALMQEGGTEALVKLVEESDESVGMYAALVLGKLANGSDLRSSAIMAEGGLTALIRLLVNSSKEAEEAAEYKEASAGVESSLAQEFAAGAMWRLAQDSEERKQAIVDEGGLAGLMKLVADGGSWEARGIGAQLLESLAMHSEKRREAMLAEGVVPALKELMEEGIGECRAQGLDALFLIDGMTVMKQSV